jgi:hypothetical protein
MRKLKNIRKYLMPFMLALVIVSQAVLPASVAIVSSSDGVMRTVTEFPNAFWGIRERMMRATDADVLPPGQRNPTLHKENRASAMAAISAAQDGYDLLVGNNANLTNLAANWFRDGDARLSVLTTWWLWAGEAAEFLQDFEAMKHWYGIYLIFIERQKWNWGAAERLDVETFTIPSIELKLKVYTVDPIFFTELPPGELNTVYTGAMHEPRQGIIWGAPNMYNIRTVIQGNPLIAANTKTPSGTLIYIHFGEENIADFDWKFRELAGKTDLIEVAWNIKDETNWALRQATANVRHIEETADYLAELGTPVVLRIAAEMNVWHPVPADPATFIQFFRLVADIMRERAPNVATMFSPSGGSAIGVSIMDYYPGDEYVDWIGLSNYYQYYFNGNRNASDLDNATFMHKEYANPVNKLAEIVRLFGGSKPIMLAEYGVANYSQTLREPSLEWAAFRMKQLHWYVPMFYPEIKAMFYFDVLRPEDHNNYALRNTPSINELYNRLIRENGIYLAYGQSSPDHVYAKLDSGGWTVPADNIIINTYAEVMHMPDLIVTYSVGGREVARSTEIPYRAALNLSALQNGNHNIEVTVVSASDNIIHARKNIAAVKSDGIVTIFDRSLPVPANRPVQIIPLRTGDIIGEVLYTDIVAYINGNPIPTSNIEGETFVIVEDLINYGFEVTWDRNERVLRVLGWDRNNPVSPIPVAPSDKPNGTFKTNHVYTNVRTYVAGVLVESYNIGGFTLIHFDLLEQHGYGEIEWNRPARTLSLTTR